MLSIVSVSSRTDALRKLALWAIVVFPLAASIAMRSTLYDASRHLSFIYPILVVLAVSGWAEMLTASRPTWLRRGAASCLAVGLASVLAFDIRFHPNQGVYFNELVGGPRRAFTKYDMDYWGNCVLQAVEWAAVTARSSGTVILISGNPWHLVQLDAGRFPQVSFTPPNWNRHHVHVRLARGPIDSLEELAQQPALHQVRTPDGAVLCTVIPGPAFGELEAIRRGTTSFDTNHQAKPQ